MFDGMFALGELS